MKPFDKLTSQTVILPVANIDTDQIIPARFLKVTDKKGLGANAFYDWRYDADGNTKDDCVLNTEKAKSRQILVAGDNFGCGSSREHAPWALVDYGFRVVVSISIADIFRNNSLKNGLLPIVVDEDFHHTLLEETEAEVTVDLTTQTITSDGEERTFQVEPFARYCLMNGLDQLEYLIQAKDDIKAFETKREGVA